MRLKLSHTLRFVFAEEARGMMALLRLTPKNHIGQFVDDWGIDVEIEGTVRRFVDPYGNWVHTFSIETPVSEVVVAANGTVETSETDGVVGDLNERMPPGVFRSQTERTAITAEITALADGCGGAGADPLDLAPRAQRPDR